MSNNDLPVLTVRALNSVYAELVERLADYNGIHADALHTRLDAVYTELHTRAGRENIARSMATDDLQDMLSDFEPVAALCGIRPEHAAANRRIVVDELRRRGIEAR